MLTITGRVVVARTQAPINKATVWAEVQTNQGDVSRPTTTDADGRFVLADLPAGTCTIRAYVDVGPPIGGFQFSATEGPFDLVSGRALTVSIEGKACLTGSVADATTGTPIRGAIVEILEPTDGQFRAATDADGSFQIAFVRPGSYTVRCSALGFETQTLRAFLPDALESGPLTLRLFLSPLPVEGLPDVGIVRGMVYNEMGNPAKDAEVMVVGQGQKHVVVTTRGYFDYARGSYEFANLPAGDYKITVTKPGMLPAETTVHVVPGRATWAPDISLAASPFTTPPELESLRVEPRVLTVGDPLRVSLKVKAEWARTAVATANIWGPGGWNMGFGIDTREPDGSLSHTFERWGVAGFFTLSRLSVTDTDTGKGFDVNINVTFEASPREAPPLTPESPIFRTG